ncbi:peptide-methionine (R)-S-oxide reductase MsrB [Hymenobacter properus]|uniref:peptide-methionine (R)-S-oxide reductase n=1 Tax=Hymenobacter properus TaxID=2791026 RepID=A0A931FNG9_9BACT|nr:peptide-methionine (R)-S-oxide reductase MsrB [Hymenobacter properus]MBF9142634.1 peptide-methionine (R)-S-oxide reductase MsrB [Hymenobacter properus]MBR7721442.1 peptide-methionine (R)-S-oxide reductase MsrB [Microvirga sp. SRT04]
MLRWKDIITFAKYGNPEPPHRVAFSEAEWAARLPPERFAVLRQHATEPPYRNAYCRAYAPGRYACAGCGTVLFEADEKYHAISGWPSFRQPASRGVIAYFFDTSFNMERMEARCNVCGGHLGHVFPDGPAPGGLRYCMNSASLEKQD